MALLCFGVAQQHFQKHVNQGEEGLAHACLIVLRWPEYAASDWPGALN